MSKKKILLLTVFAILVVVLVMLVLSSYAWFYTEKQHILEYENGRKNVS